MAQLLDAEWFLSLHGGRNGRGCSELGERHPNFCERRRRLAAPLRHSCARWHTKIADTRELRGGTVVVFARQADGSLQFELRGCRPASRMESRGGRNGLATADTGRSELGN